jgi:hypothetical protein
MQAYHARVREAMTHYLRSKKSMRLKRSPRVKNSPRALFGAVAVLVVFGVMAAIQLIVPREPSRADIATVAAQPEEATAEASARKAPASSKVISAGAAPATRLAAATTPANATAPDESAPNAPVPTPAAVTVTGCLERHDETFRLKDATGLDAPRSRSWRSGFLKKSSASIEVVDAANRLKLTDHVGQRVSVTGVIVDREIRLRSLQRVATSCNS